MRLFKTLLLAGVSQANDFEVIRCNNPATNATEMTISVDGDYMRTHHDALKNTFTYDGTDYTKVIDGSVLTMDLTNVDYIYLDYELVTTQTDVADSDIHFAGRTTGFRCKYPRAVTVSDSYSVENVPDPSPYVQTGFLQYDFTATVANGRTTAIIAAQHGLSSLEANVQNCTVSYANLPGHSVYPVRQMDSWADSDVCIDNRIDTTFTYANGGATVDWRTFHFNDPTSSATSQTQSVECNIHASNTLSVSAPSNCNCYDEQACLRTNGVCHDRIWHGDETEVQSTNFGSLTLYGVGTTFPVSNMFDASTTSFWHSYSGAGTDQRTLRIEFANPVDFDRLVIHTRNAHFNRYNEVCLILDDEQRDNDYCTDTDYGWSSGHTQASGTEVAGTRQPTITWQRPTQSVRSVSLIAFTANALQVADLKIHYTECGLV